MGFTAVTLCAALLVLANAGPVYKPAANKESACAVTCSGNNKFNYKLGNVYEFSYHAKTTTKMNGASEDSAMIHMDAKVEIEPLTKCDLLMRIKDASLKDSENIQKSQAFKEAMMKQPLKFSFQDGRIEHICAMVGESTWTLNIKRGILSAFQNSMDSFNHDQKLTETDVVGTCLSEYKVVSNDHKTKKVEKTKDLLGCTDRVGYHMAVQSIGYNVPSSVKSLPLMKCEYKCTQTLDLSTNTLKSSTCSEEHVFRPFSSGKNGAITTNEQTLTFTSKKKAGRSTHEHFSKRSTLLFHHQHDKQQTGEKIEAKLQELCQKVAEDVRPEVPELVNQLIEHMRQVDRDVLSRVYKKINQKKICGPKADRIKQYFHDAIAMVGTAASVGMIQDLISKRHAIGSEVEMWLLSLSFVHHPTKEMVAAATPLLDGHDVSGNILLAVSSLASSYCNVRPDCGKVSEISALIKKLMALTHDCNTQNVDAKRIVFALRALGNIGHSHEAVSHLIRCSTRRDVPAEIRIAAMDAFRRVPCDAKRTDLMGVFRDESEDSEFRINAYIALMKCPSREVLSEVRQVLAKEKSNQVGSFVWTHLTNLMETSDPHMQAIRNIVQDEKLKKEFNLDQRKFSRNYERSFFLDSIHTGAKVESNVIFSEKSFIPRSANLDLTVDLFGHAINFLEIGGRVQGMEKILENLFGPSGTKMPPVPMKRKLPINLDKSADAIRASAFLRVFGNELRYWDDKSLNELQSSLRRLMNMQAVSFSKTLQLIDSRMVIPTCVGLPLKLTMSATGSISLGAKASFQQSNFALNVDFKPSASVQVKGEMSVDAHVTRAGLKMVTVAHTSTGAKLAIRDNKFDLQIPQKKMEIFNLKTDFYIIHRNTEKKQKMIVDNVQKYEICTGKLMKQVTGLTFCQNIKFPGPSRHNEAPFFPFTGPVVFDLYMLNEDAPNGYQIGFTKQSPYSLYMDTPNSKVSRRIALDAFMKKHEKAQITFTSPWKTIKIEGTIVNMEEMKKLTGKLSVDGRTDYTLNAELGMKNTKGLWSITPKFEITIPQKKMKYEGKIEVMPMKTLMIDMSAIGFIASDINLKVSGEIVPKKIGLTTLLKIGMNEYHIASRLERLVWKTGFKYSPYLKITIPKRDLVEFTSVILYESNKKMSFDFKLNKVLPKTVAMNAIVLLNAGKTKTKHILKVVFKSPLGNFKIIGDMDINKAGITSKVIGTYKFGAKYSDHLTLSTKIRNLSDKKSVRYMGHIALVSKKQEFLHFNLNGQLAKAINHLETKFDLQYGNPKIKTNNLIFALVLNRALKPLIHAYDFTMTIQHPGQKINYKVEVNHVQSTKLPFTKFENKVMVQIAPGKIVQTKLSYNNAMVKGLPTYESEIALSYLGRDMKIADKLIQVNKNTYENHFTVQWQKGHEVAVQSTYTKTGKDLHNIENTLRLPNKKEAKVTVMLQAMPGAYKVKVQFAADEGIISRQRINYKAEGGVTYTFNANQMSSDVNVEIMWAPTQKVSANINFDYMKSVSFSGKLAFSTPFDAMKNFNSQAKFTWANRKYTSMMSVSWNNQLKSEIVIAMTNMSLNGNIKVSHDKTKLINIIVNAQKMGNGIEMGLDINILDSEIKINLKHNNELCSLVMSYSSPLRNYRNGKMTIKIKRNLPNMLKAKMDLTLNGNLMFNMNVGYVIVKHNAQKMGIEGEMGLDFNILDSNGKMNINLKFDQQKGEVMSNGEGKLNLPFQQLHHIDASYNLKHNNELCSLVVGYSSSLRNYRNGKMTIEMKRNLPNMLKAKMDLTLNGNLMFNMNVNYGRHKDNIDMKIDITEPSGDKITVLGNLNLSGNRKTGKVGIKSKYINLSADVAFEYQGTHSAGGELKVTANGKSVVIRANYKKEGSTYKVTGTLVLPDGRSLKIEGSLDLKNIAASLKTIHPQFPGLTEVDMAFSFNGDRRMFSSKASLKVMPYLDTIQVEMKFTKKQISIEMKTRFESMKQAKVTVKFDGDWVRSERVKAVFQLNNEQILDLGMHYHFKSIRDFIVSVTALTSHKRYKEFQFKLKNKGPLSDMHSHLKLKLGKVLMFEAIFQNSRWITKVSLNAQLLDFDEWKSIFELRGHLDHMTATITTSIAKKEVNRVEVSLKKYGRWINVKVNGPKAVHFTFNMDLTNMVIGFSMASTFTLNGREKYEMSVSYEHLSKLQIKTSIPSYKHELLIMFSGNLKAFNVQIKFSHNNLMYELMLSNKEYYRQLKGILNTPYFQDTATFRLDGKLNKMSIVAQVMHNKEKFELTFSNSGYYQQIHAKLDTPYSRLTLEFSLIGNPKKFNCELKIHFNNQIYEMKASNGNYFRQINFLLDTPFLKCNFQFKGDLENAEGTFTVLYGKTKYELTISNKNFFQDFSLTVTIPKHVLNINGKLVITKKAATGHFNIIYNKEKMSLSVSIELGLKKVVKADLDTPYFKDSLTVVLNGIPKKFHAQVKVIHNGKTYELTLSNNYVRNIHVEVTTPQTGNIMFGYDLQGDLNNFNLKSELSYKKNTYVMNVLRDIKTGELRLTIVSPQINVNVHLNVDWKSFSFNAKAVVNKGKYEMMASTKNYFREITVKMITPQFGEQSLLVKINGQLSDLSGLIELKINNKMYRSEFSLKNQEFHLSLPKWLKKLQVKINGNWKNFEFIVQIMNYNGEIIEISATNKNFQEMKAHIAIPKLDNIDISVKTSGNLRKGWATMKMIFGKNVLENKVGINFDSKKAHFKIRPHYKILGRSGKAKLKIDLMLEAQSYKYEFEADVEGTQVKSMASVKISPEIIILMTVNVPTFQKSEMKLHIVSNGWQKTELMLNLKSPWTGLTKIFYEHNGQMVKSSAGGYIVKDGIRLAGFSLDTVFSGDYSFVFKCDCGNSKDKIEIKGNLKFHGIKTVATLSVITPFRVFKEVFVVAQTKMLRDGLRVELNVKLPNQQYSLEIHWSNNNFNALLVLNMDKKNRHKQYQFHTTYAITNHRADVSRSFNFEMILPQRAVSLDWHFENTQKSLVVNADLMWDEARGQKVGFELMVQKADQKEAKLRIITPRRTVELFGKVGVNGNHYFTVGHIMMGENKKLQKVDIKADIMILSNGADIDITVKLPNQKKGMNLKTSVNLLKGDIIFSSSSVFSIDQDPKRTFKMSTKVTSETKGKRQIYTVQMDAFAIKVIGRVSISPEKYNADIEIGYLNLKHQQKKLAIHVEMHRFNRVVHLKLESPTKTIELDGSLSAGNRLMLSMLKQESGKANPNKLFQFDVDVMKSKATFKVHHTNKQMKQFTDGIITVELTATDILKSHIKWNPHFLEGPNVHGYQEVGMNGQKLQSLGDSLSQVLDDELSKKLAFTKLSFNEDMAPIMDYFVTEYNTISQAFARATSHMDQIFEKDPLYAKSAFEAIDSILNETMFKRYLMEVRLNIEAFNRNMNNRMNEAKKQLEQYYGEYSNKLREIVDKVSAFTQEKNEMLYQRLINVEAKFVSLVKNCPTKINELIERMRQNLYGKKVMDFLKKVYATFNQEKFQNKDHVKVLTSAIYSAHATVNRHIDVSGLMDTMYTVGAKKIKDIITDVGINTFVFDTKRGEISAEVPLGVCKCICNCVMSSVKYVEQALMKLSNLVPNTKCNIWDIYYRFKPSIDLDDYILPFKAEATLFSAQHITTFDGRHLHYKGTCSYILAHDFVDGTFTVVANFNADRKAKTLKSLTVTTAHNEQLEIFPDNKVLLNRRVVNLPLQLTDATVTHQGNLIVVKSERGYKVMCDHDLQLYTVQISGWYFNKVAGLFGNYNNEPKDEMIMPNMEVTTDLEKFVQSWSASKQCKSHHNIAPRNMVIENKQCTKLFVDQESPFRYCFRQVKPEQYSKTCAIDMASSKATSIDLCKVTAIYQKKCYTKGVDLMTPDMCRQNM